MNLLPGLRELRAPLVSGYLWLISAWLFLGRMEWLPTERPEGNGEVTQLLWDLGGTLGKTVVLAAVTFIAYLIGSFLELDPDGPIATSLAPVVLADRRPWYLSRRSSELVEDARTSLNLMWDSGWASKVAQSISLQARTDLYNVLSRRNMLPTIPYNEAEAEKHQLMGEMTADHFIFLIIQEMRQLASRLLVENKDLYGKYDRHMAEASVRMNVSIPLTVLLVLATWLSGFPIWLRLVLTLIALAFGFILLRQGFLRAVSARDVIVQALVIGEVESRHIPAEEETKSPAEEPAARTQPTEVAGPRAPAPHSSHKGD